MIVVPALAEPEHADDPLVVALIRGVEAAPAELMANRVHRPGQMVRDEHAHQSTPEEPAPAVDEIRDDEAQNGPGDPGAAHEHGDTVLEQMPGILLRVAA